MIEIVLSSNKKVDAFIDGFTVKTDQPVKSGGDNTAPSPFSLFLASLGTCAGVYVKSFCDQRKIPTDGIRLEMYYEYNPVQKMIAKFIIRIFVPADFPEKYEGAMINAAALCAVKRHLNENIQNEISVVRSSVK